MSANTSPDFDFPESTSSAANNKGPLIPGSYAATLIEIKPPKPSNMKNDQGENPLTSIFVWAVDGFPDFNQWSYVNVEARGEKSNLYKVILAMTGTKITKHTKLKSGQLLNGRCLLMLVPNGDEGYMKVSGYYPEVKAPARPVAATADAVTIAPTWAPRRKDGVAVTTIGGPAYRTGPPQPIQPGQASRELFKDLADDTDNSDVPF